MQATDLRVAAESASFALQEVKWAIIPAGGSLVRLVRQMPYCKAMEILLTGNRIAAAEAWRLGLINYVLPQADVMAKAEELARAIAENGPMAVRAIKETVEKCSGSRSRPRSRSKTRPNVSSARPRTRAKARAPSSKSANRTTTGVECVSPGSGGMSQRYRRPQRRRRFS